MTRRATRHATDEETLAAIEEIELDDGQILTRGVAGRELELAPTSGNIPAQYQPAQMIATQQAQQPYLGTPFQPARYLPDYLDDQLTPGLADRTGPGVFQKLQDWHVWPGLAAGGGLGCGWGAAATEPMHAVFGGAFTAGGIAALGVYSAIHVIRAINSDGEDGGEINVGVHALGLGGVAVTGFGVACVAGLSYLSAGVGLAVLGAAYWAWFQSKHGRLTAQRRFLIGITAAATPHSVSLPSAAAADRGAGPLTIDGELVSAEETVVRRAFEGIGIALQDVHSFKRIDEDSWGVTVVLAPAAGVSPESVIARRDVLTSAMGANQVIALTTRRGHEVRLTARFGDIDPLAETIPFPGPVATSITEPLPIAEAADGTKGELLLLGTHTLIGGATNGGKSVILKVLVISIANLRDAVMWLWDLKPGRIELGIFEKVADRSAKNLTDAAMMLEALLAIAQERGDILAELREQSNKLVEKWDPTVQGPVIVAVFDEFAELVRLAKKIRKGQFTPTIMEAVKNIAGNFETCVQVFRALGIQIVIATQSPSSSITSGKGKDGLDQIQNLVCVQTAKISQTNIILGQGAHGDGYRAHTDLYVSGMCFMHTPQVRTPVKHKAYWVDNDEIVTYAQDLSEIRPRLDPRSAARADEVLGDLGLTPITTPPPSGGGGIETDEDRPAAARRAGRTPLHVVPAACYPDGTQIPYKYLALWQLLGSYDAPGATVSQLAFAAADARHENCSLAWVRDACKEWRTRGVVVMAAIGRDNHYFRDDEALAARLRRTA